MMVNRILRFLLFFQIPITSLPIKSCVTSTPDIQRRLNTLGMKAIEILHQNGAGQGGQQESIVTNL